MRLPSLTIVFVSLAAMVASSATPSVPLERLVAADLSKVLGRAPEPAASRRYTNAERLSRGLSPNKPLFNRQRRQGAVPSGVPPATWYISVTNDISGQSLGWISTELNVAGMIGLTTDTSKRLLVKGQTQDLVFGRANLEVANGAFSYPSLGFAESTGLNPDNLPWAAGSSSNGFLVNTEEKLVGPSGPGLNSLSSPDPDIPEPETAIQSSMWTLNLSTGELTATYTNHDLSTHPAVLTSFKDASVSGGLAPYIWIVADYAVHLANLNATPDIFPKVSFHLVAA